MPAILKESLPNSLASILYSQSYAPIGVGEGSRPWWPPLCMVLAACGSATLCHVVGGSTIRCFAPPPLDSLAYMRPLASWSILSSSDWCIRFGRCVHYQSLPDPMLTVRNWMVLLVWLPGGLPSLTTRHMHSGLDFGQVLRGITRCYHALPCLHRESPPVLDLYQPPPPARHTHRHTYKAHSY